MKTTLIKHTIFIGLLFLSLIGKAQSFNTKSSYELISRVVPTHQKQFVVKAIPVENGKDVFAIESKNNKIILSGSSPIAVASALNWYLKYYCNVQRSWCGDNMELPKKLPIVLTKVKQNTPYEWRSYLNYCTFNYSMTWWSWERWEKEIDWMAMHGVNMPLAITGQEAVWQNTLRKYGMSDDEIREFLVGPAYAAWQWMTNIEGVFGPLPQQWIDRSVVLGKKILARERELGMTPILQGFTGYVPISLIEKQPNAKILQKPVWFFVGKGPAQLDPLDPLFDKITKTFLEEQTKLFGTNHFYAADPFHEGAPPVSGNEYLAAVGKKIFEATTAVDPKATIAMQTWSMREAIMEAIPNDKILMLDLNSSKWRGSKAFWGKPWLAGIIHNFGGNAAMGGNLQAVLSRFPSLLNNAETKQLKGIGMFPEAIEHNPIIYEAASEMTWHSQMVDTEKWLHGYLKSRYGSIDKNTKTAWDILLKTIYGTKNSIETFMEGAVCARPALQVNGASPNGSINKETKYAFKELWPAVELLQNADNSIKNKDTYKYDLVDLMRQSLSDLSIPLQRKMADAYRNNQPEQFTVASKQFLDLIDDFDELLGTRKEFLLGKWIADARAIGKTSAEKNLYEQNARSLITIWGPYDPNAIQYDYSARQWNGLVSSFYKVRWQMFVDMLHAELKKDIASRYQEIKITHRFNRPKNNANNFYEMIAKWEAKWAATPAALTSQVPSNKEIETVKKLYNKWKPVADKLYTGKP